MMIRVVLLKMVYKNRKQEQEEKIKVSSVLYVYTGENLRKSSMIYIYIYRMIDYCSSTDSRVTIQHDARRRQYENEHDRRRRRNGRRIVQSFFQKSDSDFEFDVEFDLISLPPWVCANETMKKRSMRTASLLRSSVRA